MSLSGSDSASLTEVALVELSGSEEVKGVLVPQDDGNYLVQVDRIPTVEFVLRVTGILPSSSNVFQRQSPTNFRASNLTMTVSNHVG